MVIVMKLLNLTLSDVLSQNATQFPKDAAYIFEGKLYTWRQIDRITDNMAIVMLEDGVRKGTHVGLWGVNSVALVCTLYAAMKIGAVPTILNYSYKAIEVQSLVSYADVEFLYYGESTGSLSYPNILAQMQKKAPLLKLCRDLTALFQDAAGKGDVGEEIRQRLEAVKSAVTTDDTACMLFTSGTTRQPKGVLLSYHSILNDARTIDELMHWDREKDSLLSAMPIFHCSGMTCGLMLGMVLGMKVVLMRTFKAEEAMALIEKYRCTAFNVVPSMLMRMVQSPAFGQYDLSSWQSGTVSGSGMTAEQYEQLADTIGVPHLQMGYGQTETAPLITFSDFDDDLHVKANTIGISIPHMEVRIWDVQNDQEASPNRVGEIQARGFCVMQGYYKLDEENQKKFTSDGWLRTGDMGFRDGKGYFHFTSRISEMIVRGGENISPSEVECIIKHFSDDIVDVKVIGMEVDTAMQEEIVAFLKMEPGTHVDGEKVSDYVKTHLASFKAPQHVWELGTFPMTGSGKIDQKALKQLAIELTQQR